jgi:hypothetical protein
MVNSRASGRLGGFTRASEPEIPAGRLEPPLYTRGMAKRGYSREFTPQTDRRVRFEVDRIPPTLYEAVKAKAKREGISLRALTLRLWKEWVNAREA